MAWRKRMDDTTEPMRPGDSCPHHLRPDEYDMFMGSAEARGAFVFEEMDRLLDLLKASDPVRVWSLRRDLKWLRKHAKKVGYGWGA